MLQTPCMKQNICMEGEICLPDYQMNRYCCRCSSYVSGKRFANDLHSHITGADSGFRERGFEPNGNWIFIIFDLVNFTAVCLVTQKKEVRTNPSNQPPRLGSAPALKNFPKSETKRRLFCLDFVLSLFTFLRVEFPWKFFLEIKWPARITQPQKLQLCRGGGGGGGTPIYFLYGDVPPDRVSFSGSSVLNRVSNFTFSCLKQGYFPKIFFSSPPPQPHFCSRHFRVISSYAPVETRATQANLSKLSLEQGIKLEHFVLDRVAKFPFLCLE